MSALVPAHSSAEGELRTEVSRLQQTNASLQSDMIMKHVPLQDLHASRAEKYAADAALAKFAECVQSWAQRRGDAVPGQQLLAPATPEHVAALFEYVKSGSRKHLASASTPRHNKRTAEQAGLSASGGGGGASPFASPAVSPLVDGEQVAGLHAQLVELEGRLKAAQLEAVAHDEQLAAAAAEQQALRDRLTAKETEITQHAEAASASAAAATSSAAAAAKHSAEKAAAEQLAVAETQARESQALELAKAGAEQRADETAAKLAEAATTAEDIRTQTDRVRTQLSQELQVAQQAKSELLEQREPMQRALESAQAQAEQSERGKRELKAQLEERGAAHAQLTQRVEASEHDRAALKQRLEGTASKVDQLAAAATEQQALHDRLAAKETEIAQHVAAAAAAATRQQQEAADRTAAPAGMSTAAPEYLPHSEKSESQQTTQAVEDDEPVGTLTVTPASEMQERTTLEVSSASPAAAASSPAAPAPKRASSKRKSSAQPAEDNDYESTGPRKVMLTGFTDRKTQKIYAGHLAEMGVSVKKGNAFDKTITHVVAPVSTMSWKAIAGSLSCRWVIHEGWIRESYKTYQRDTSAKDFFADEARFGTKKEHRVMRGQNWAFSTEFITRNAEKVPLMKSVIAFGGGKIRSDTGWEDLEQEKQQNVTHVIIGEGEAHEDPWCRAVALNYKEFVGFCDVWPESAAGLNKAGGSDANSEAKRPRLAEARVQ